LAGQRHPRVVQPEPGERVTGRVRLGALVLVVREDQVHATAVDVELAAEVGGRHRRALQVPARTPGAPRRRPGRLARLRALPQREVARVALAACQRLALLDLVETLPGQLAVTGERLHGEVDVTARRVGVPFFEQA